MSIPPNQPPSLPGPGPTAGTAVDDPTGDSARSGEPDAAAARSPWGRPASATTSNLPLVEGADDPYLDRNRRAPNGAVPPVGSATSAGAPATNVAGATAAAAGPSDPPAPRPAPPSAVDQYAALGLDEATTTTRTPTGTPGGATSAATPIPAAPAVARPVRRGRGERTPRRARLQLRHFNVWTVFKFSVVLAVALFFVWMIIVAVLYGLLDHLKVIDKINKTVQTVENNSDTNDAVTPRIIFTSAFLIGLVDLVLFIVLTTIGSVVYNLCADLVGGIEVTLAERD